MDPSVASCWQRPVGAGSLRGSPRFLRGAVSMNRPALLVLAWMLLLTGSIRGREPEPLVEGAPAEVEAKAARAAEEKTRAAEAAAEDAKARAIRLEELKRRGVPEASIRDLQAPPTPSAASPPKPIVVPPELQ